MKHALSTRCIASHRLTTVWLERIWDAGIPAVELYCARQHLDYHDKAQITELGHWFRDAQLKVHSVHSPTTSDNVWGRSGPAAHISITETIKAKRIQMIDEIKRALDIAETVPFAYFVQHLGEDGEEFDERKLDAAFTSLEELSLFARQRDVELLLENGLSALSTAERLEYFKGITHLKLNYCFNTGKAHLCDGIEPELDTMKAHVRAIHVHDNNGKPSMTGKEVAHDLPLPGFGGAIDWRKTMGLLRAAAPEAALILEVDERASAAKPLEDIRRAFDWLENLKPLDEEQN
jgi:sugar phosphate isomerase/epimerase